MRATRYLRANNALHMRNCVIFFAIRKRPKLKLWQVDFRTQLKVHHTLCSPRACLYRLCVSACAYVCVSSVYFGVNSGHLCYKCVCVWVYLCGNIMAVGTDGSAKTAAAAAASTSLPLTANGSSNNKAPKINTASSAPASTSKSASAGLPASVSHFYYKHGLFLSSYPTCASSIAFMAILLSW